MLYCQGPKKLSKELETRMDKIIATDGFDMVKMKKVSNVIDKLRKNSPATKDLVTWLVCAYEHLKLAD